MSGSARLGRWILVVVIVIIALSEVFLAILSIQAGRFRGNQIGRVLLTGWLLWRVWDGTVWARWLMVVCCIAAVVFALVVAIGSPNIEERPDLLAFLVGGGAAFGMMGMGLASPWVGAYQTARRATNLSEQGAQDDLSPRHPFH